MGEKVDALRESNLTDFDSTLYAARRARAGLNILVSMDTDSIANFDQMEQLQLIWLFIDRIKEYIPDIDQVIKDLVDASAKNPEVLA